jgi:hypothetical protein
VANTNPERAATGVTRRSRIYVPGATVEMLNLGRWFIKRRLSVGTLLLVSSGVGALVDTLVGLMGAVLVSAIVAYLGLSFLYLLTTRPDPNHWERRI